MYVCVCVCMYDVSIYVSKHVFICMFNARICMYVCVCVCMMYLYTCQSMYDLGSRHVQSLSLYVYHCMNVHVYMYVHCA